MEVTIITANGIQPGVLNSYDSITVRFKRGDHIRSATHDGVAFWYLCPCENEDHHGCHIAIMVGDDHEWHLDVADITLLDRDEFCGECGQIGCGHDGR
jgi:hypothetical protein